MVDVYNPSARELKRSSGLERLIAALLDIQSSAATVKLARRRHVTHALRAEAMQLNDAWGWTGITAAYNEALQERLAELNRLVARLGRFAEQPFIDGLIVRRGTPQVPMWEPGTHINAVEVIRHALRKLGLPALPSHLAGLARLREKLRRMGLHLDGFFGQAKVDGRNNP